MHTLNLIGHKCYWGARDLYYGCIGYGCSEAMGMKTDQAVNTLRPGDAYMRQ